MIDYFIDGFFLYEFDNNLKPVDLVRLMDFTCLVRLGYLETEKKFLDMAIILYSMNDLLLSFNLPFLLLVVEAN